jgi:hypothetical protein
MELRAVLQTDSGMHVLWDRAHFASVVDYNTWEQQLLEDADIESHIALGHLVPINIHSDGAFAFTLRIGESETPILSPDEQTRVVVQSEAYRFLSGGCVDLSGLEYVAGVVPVDGRVATAFLTPGEYEVCIHLMDYEDIADKTDAHPDFIILVGPPTGAAYRRSVNSFGG